MNCAVTDIRPDAPGHYMLRLRKYADQPLTVDGSVYDAVHHIFLQSYQQFTRAFPAYPQNRQSIHLYPGGGFLPHNTRYARYARYAIHPDVLLFPTQAFTVDYVATFFPNNTALPVFGGPFVSRGVAPVKKPRHVDLQPLTVCFTSLGVVIDKGADHYLQIAELFATTYPADNVIFLGVGIVPPSPAVAHLRAMPQTALDAFYQQTVDIMFNLDRTDCEHGWPLGTEGLVKGAVLFSTDLHNMNERNGYRFGEEVFIVNETHMNRTVDQLHAYYEDRDMLHRHSLAGQHRAHHLFGFDKQMRVVLGAIDERVDGLLNRNRSTLP